VDDLVARLRHVPRDDRAGVLRRGEERRVTCEIAAREVDVVLFYDAAPKELVQRFSRHTGRTRGVPDWALAPWNDAIRGEGEVRRLATLLRREKIPSSAMWTEDWQNGSWSFFGDSRWSWYNINPVRRDVDRRRYPNFEALSGELHGGGFKFLGYCYPYVPVEDEAYEGAATRGLFPGSRPSCRSSPAAARSST
jgi:alpha-glucosidase (family GH31 glycosyl hydrolase)